MKKYARLFSSSFTCWSGVLEGNIKDPQPHSPSFCGVSTALGGTHTSIPYQDFLFSVKKHFCAECMFLTLSHTLSLSHTHTLSLSLSIYLSVFGPFTPVHTRPSHRYRRRDPQGGHDCHRHCTMEPSAPGSISGKLSVAKPSAGSVSC